jgi:cytochrome c553
MINRRHFTAASLALAVAMAFWHWLAQLSGSAGAELFDGRRPISAQVDGHGQNLPPHAGRCINCHSASAAPANALGAGTAAFGPGLTAASLTQLQARRGGPPSRFDMTSFCKLLRTGIDPAWVTLTKTMPRYAVSDAECAELWAYLELQ